MIDIVRGQQLLLKQVGKPYIFGYEVKINDPNPEAFDCSELVEWFFHQMGVYVPDGSYNQFPATTPVVMPQPFDLGFLLKNGKTVHHVGIVYDKEFIIHARGSHFGVVKEPLTNFSKINGFSGWRRLKCLIS